MGPYIRTERVPFFFKFQTTAHNYCATDCTLGSAVHAGWWANRLNRACGTVFGPLLGSHWRTMSHRICICRAGEMRYLAACLPQAQSNAATGVQYGRYIVYRLPLTAVQSQLPCAHFKVCADNTADSGGFAGRHFEWLTCPRKLNFVNATINHQTEEIQDVCNVPQPRTPKKENC